MNQKDGRLVLYLTKQHAHAEIVTVTDADLIQIVLVWCRL